ncbi:hypothetical protein [Flavobacterium faecale]|uniref:hypothetical protein n=1 Tax=Flavobacterium faecale TaxID=1355330 RepID=UPI003AAF2265
MKNNKTQKIIGFFSLVVMLMAMGCKDKAPEKEVIVMPEKTTIIEKETTVSDSTSGTSISVDKDGVNVESEKLDVKVGK